MVLSTNWDFESLPAITNFSLFQIDDDCDNMCWTRPGILIFSQKPALHVFKIRVQVENVCGFRLHIGNLVSNSDLK